MYKFTASTNRVNFLPVAELSGEFEDSSPVVVVAPRPESAVVVDASVFLAHSAVASESARESVFAAAVTVPSVVVVPIQFSVVWRVVACISMSERKCGARAVSYCSVLSGGQFVWIEPQGEAVIRVVF